MALEREKLGEREQKSSKDEPFHVIHKVPPGDTPYVRAKYAQVNLYPFVCFRFVR